MTKRILLACSLTLLACPSWAAGLSFEKLVVSDLAVLHRTVLSHWECLREARAEAAVLREAGRQVWFADCVLVDHG